MANKPRNPRKGMQGPYGESTKQINKQRMAEAKASGYTVPKVTKSSDGFKSTPKSISAPKPSVKSVAVKGAKNKMKAQGAKMNMTPSTTAAARARAAKKN